MTLRERCEKFYENIGKLKEAFYNYDWEKLDSKYILRYRKSKSNKFDYVLLRIDFLRELRNLANLSDDFVIDDMFINELVEQKMIDSYVFNVEGYTDYIKIFLDKYEENQQSYARKETDETNKLKIASSLIRRKNSTNEENPLNNNYKTGYLSDVGSELCRKFVWNKFYNNDIRLMIKPHIHDLMEKPYDVPTKKSCDGVLLFVFSIPGNRNIVTFPGYYDENDKVWKRSCNDAPIPKDMICGWVDFQIFENVAETKMFEHVSLDITCPREISEKDEINDFDEKEISL